MDNNRPVLITTEYQQQQPLLIVDKKGVIGTALANALSDQFLVVLVSGKEGEAHKNLVHVPYHRKIPRIPDEPYAPIFVVYNGEEEILDMLSSFVQKAEKANARVFFITSLLYSKERLFKFLSHHQYRNISVIVCGETFDNALSEVNSLNFFIHQARLYGRVEIPDAGLGKLYPVLLHDVIVAIIATSFSLEHKQQTLLVFPKHPFAEFTVVRIMQKLDPILKLDFRKQQTDQPTYYIPEGIYAFHEYDLEERLKQIDFTRREYQVPLPPQKKVRLPKLRRTRKRPLLFLALGILLLLLPLVATIALTGGGFYALTAAVKAAEEGKFDSAKSSMTLAQQAFGGADFASDGILLWPLLAKEQTAKLDQAIMIGKEVSDTGRSLMDVAVVFQGVFEGKSVDPTSDFLHATATFKNALLTLQKLQAENQLPEDVQEKFQKLQPVVAFLENTSDTWPALLGFEGKRKYLLLFQNNMELRPGGGFIGSYGVIDVEKGKFGKLQILDVYDADGQLKTHIEPPYGLRRYAGSSHWFLRDSNFAVDFPTNAIQAAQVLNLETKEKVDGVIAIDTTFLKKILEAMGSVTVHDYNETVTPDNFYLLTQTHAEKDFFPGSTQKKDFLKALFNTMLANLAEKKDIPYQALLEKAGEALVEKHVLFAFPDEATQNVFTVNGYASALWDGRTGEGNTFFDFLGISDANVGANKSNYYLTRSIVQEATIDEKGSLQTTVTVKYTNSSKEDSPFGGEYKNYVRFVLPQRASLQDVIIDGKAMQTIPALTDPAVFTKKGFIPPAELEVEKTQVAGKEVFGFLVIVPTGSTRNVVITYEIPSVINADDASFSYNLRLFKQPGTVEDEYSATLSYPQSFQLVQADSKGVDLGGKVVYGGKLKTDIDLTAKFSKK